MIIVQISDIHIGGEYNGQFKVKENFEKAISNIPCCDLLVISGDLADDNYKENYIYIKEILKSVSVNSIVVLPGNHDSMEYINLIEDEDNDIQVCTTSMVHRYGKNNIGFINTYDGILHKEYLDLVKDCSTIFTHYPLTKITHNFMNKFSLKNLEESDEWLSKTKIENIICGHFHFDYVEKGVRSTYVCPSTQCQIDSVCNEFKVGSYEPGYRIIGLDESYIDSCVKYYDGKYWYPKCVRE